VKSVVIVGRPNVGKSSLFNRLIGRRRAIVLDTPGVTRDRIRELVSWHLGDQEEQLVFTDTGGLGTSDFQDEIKGQVERALEDATLVLFVIDSRAGITTEDRQVFSALRRGGVLNSIPVWLLINKVDQPYTTEEDLVEFHEFGLEEWFAISAEHNLGIEQLKEAILAMPAPESAESVSDLPTHSDEDQVEEEGQEQEETEIKETVEPIRIPRIAIVGQPNVGKSTLLNAIAGDARSVTSPIAGTTVDPVDSLLEWGDQTVLLIDTAGVRKKSKTEEGIEVLSVVQTIKTLERADLALLVLDGEKGIGDQDEKIAGLIEDAGCSVVLVLNKWDTQKENDDFNQKEADARIRKQIRFLGYAPLVFTTATEGKGLERLLRTIQSVLQERIRKVSTREVTELIGTMLERNNPADAKMYLVQQVGRRPPRFIAHINDPNKVHFSLKRHLVNGIREKFGFSGTPIRLEFKASTRRTARQSSR
jgi:GTPase